MLVKLSVDQALIKAKSYAKKGEVAEAEKIYLSILKNFSKNQRALKGLASLNHVKGKNDSKGLPQEIINELLKLLNKGDSSSVFHRSQILTKQYPDSFILWNIFGVSAAQLNKFEKAIEAFKKSISIKPNYAEAYNNLGNVLKDQGKLDEAINAYKKYISIVPNNAFAYYNLGNVLQKQDKFNYALNAYNEAIKINPKYAEAHFNLGVMLQKQGKLKKAEESFKKVVTLNPNYAAEAHFKLGFVLQKQGELKRAVERYTNAITLKLDYAEAYNNLGNTYKDLGQLKKAEAVFKQAIAIKPKYADAYWNLHGIQESIQDAEYWIDRCLASNFNHFAARLTKSALRFYQGDRNSFDNLMQSKLKHHPLMRSFSWVFSLPKLPELHFDKYYFFDNIIKKSITSKPFYEFGVWWGSSFKYLIKAFQKGYGFDTFTGLPEEWDVGSHIEKKGAYTSYGNIPKIKGGEFIIGKFEETLPIFFSEKRPVASVINFDADLYSSTICALNFSKSIIDKDTILIFDELITNENWEQDEFRALNDFCSMHNFSYEVIAVSFFSKQVAVKLIGI